MQPTERLEQWLKETDLPDDATSCLRNFVMSCDNPDDLDNFNFVNIDTMNYTASVRQKLFEGYSFAYTGERVTILVVSTPQVYDGRIMN